MSAATLVVFVSTLLLIRLDGLSAVQDFTGPGTVSCPLDDFLVADCIPSFLNNDPSECNDVAQSCVFVTLPLAVDTDTIEFALPCDCTVALECPDSCELLPTEEGSLGLNGTIDIFPSTNGTGVDFTGPGLVACPALDFFPAMCVPDYTALIDCDGTESCAVGDVPEPDDSIIYLPLPCSCVTARNCPESCTFEPFENTNSTNGSEGSGIDFTGGPGFLECPVDDYSDAPCDSFVLRDDCADPSECGSLRFIPGLDENATNTLIPLRCECIIAIGCPESCVFIAGEIPASLDSTLSPSPGPDGTAVPTPATNQSANPAPFFDADLAFNFTLSPTTSTMFPLDETQNPNDTQNPDDADTVSPSASLVPTVSNASVAPSSSPNASIPAAESPSIVPTSMPATNSSEKVTEDETTAPARSRDRPDTRSPTSPPLSSGMGRSLTSVMAVFALSCLI